MIRTIVVLIASAGLLVAANTAKAQTFDTRDILGGGPNFFGTGASPIRRTTVYFPENYAPGTIVINTAERRLYLVEGNGQALRYGIGVGRDGFRWSGVHHISAKKEWPSWTPPREMLARRPDLPRHMEGGIENPLGARAMYLGSTLYRIHGSNEPETIGQAVSSGCFRMTNEDVTDLYNRVSVGALVIVKNYVAHALRSRSRRAAMAALASLCFIVAAFIVAALPSAAAEIPAVAARQRAEKKSFTDAEIVDGFLKTSFGAEYHMAGRVDRIRKYVRPIKVFSDSRRADRKAQLAKVVADIAAHVKNLDIAMTETGETADITVRLVRDRDLYRTIVGLYGNDRAKEIRISLDPQCLSGFRKNENYEIEHSDVILTVDNGDFIFLDCAYEELLQSLGPINDTSSVPWTMFNDDVSMGFFDVYDQYILNLLYDPRIKAGMTVDEVKAVLPEVLPDVRAFVKKLNNLKE